MGVCTRYIDFSVRIGSDGEIVVFRCGSWWEPVRQAIGPGDWRVVVIRTLSDCGPLEPGYRLTRVSMGCVVVLAWCSCVVCFPCIIPIRTGDKGARLNWVSGPVCSVGE